MFSVALNLFMIGNKIAYTYYVVNNIKYTLGFVKSGVKLIRDRVVK